MASKKELRRLKILEQLKKKKLTVKERTESLAISERQIYRLVKRYREEGDKGLLHRSRGKPSNRGYPEDLKEKVIKIYRKSYKDFGPTLFTEKLGIGVPKKLYDGKYDILY